MRKRDIYSNYKEYELSKPYVTELNPTEGDALRDKEETLEEFEKATIASEPILGAKNQPVPRKPVLPELVLDESLFDEDVTPKFVFSEDYTYKVNACSNDGQDMYFETSELVENWEDFTTTEEGNIFVEDCNNAVIKVKVEKYDNEALVETFLFKKPRRMNEGRLPNDLDYVTVNDISYHVRKGILGGTLKAIRGVDEYCSVPYERAQSFEWNVEELKKEIAKCQAEEEDEFESFCPNCQESDKAVDRITINNIQWACDADDLPHSLILGVEDYTNEEEFKKMVFDVLKRVYDCEATHFDYEQEDLPKSFVEKLVNPNDDDLQKLRDVFDRYGFEIESEGPALPNGIHFQIIKSDCLYEINDEIDGLVGAMGADIDKVREETKCPINISYGHNKDNVLTASVDILFKDVNDDVKEVDEENQSLDIKYPNITLEELPDSDLIDTIPEEFESSTAEQEIEGLTDLEIKAIANVMSDAGFYTNKKGQFICCNYDEMTLYNSAEDLIKSADFTIIEMDKSSKEQGESLEDWLSESFVKGLSNKLEERLNPNNAESVEKFIRQIIDKKKMGWETADKFVKDVRNHLNGSKWLSIIKDKLSDADIVAFKDMMEISPLGEPQTESLNEELTDLEKECKNLYYELRNIIMDGANADVPNNIKKAFEKIGGKAYVIAHSPEYLEINGIVDNSYKTKEFISLNNFDLDVKILIEDMVMAYYRTHGGEGYRTPELIKRILAESLEEDFDLSKLDQEGCYRFLARMKSDCDYFLGNGNRSEKHLWAGSVKDQIKDMRYLYNRVKEKPEWLSKEDIDSYEKSMLDESLNEAKSSNWEKIANKLGIEESLDESLIDPTEEDIQKLRDIFAKYGFEIEREGRNLFGGYHFQIIDKDSEFENTDDMRLYVSAIIADIDELEKDIKCPVTWNFGPDKDNHITAGVDMLKKFVNDK